MSRDVFGHKTETPWSSVTTTVSISTLPVFVTRYVQTTGLPTGIVGLSEPLVVFSIVTAGADP